MNLFKDKKNTTNSAEKEQSLSMFYQPNKTCQINKLGWLFEKHFGKTSSGCFVEVGAFDGEYVSNTSNLADIGWQGFYIEPIPQYFKKCSKRHKRNTNTTVSNIAIGDCEKDVEINVGGVLSSIDKASTARFKDLNWAKSLISDEYVSVKQITLNDFLSNNAVPKNFNLLSIDVEGYELNVLKGFDISHWSPKMVIIELHDQNFDYKDEWESMDKIVEYMEDNNYRVVYKDFTNTVYVKKQ